MKRILFCMLAMIVVLGLGTTAQAALILDGQGTSVHGTHNLIYDDDLDITWYDYSNDLNNWGGQRDWALGLSVDFGGTIFDDWRLPTTVDDISSYGYDKTTSEMGHLYYTELLNSALGPLSNTGDFRNLKSSVYWSDTGYSADTGLAWRFGFNYGRQVTPEKIGFLYGLAVRSGDVAAPDKVPAAVPEPTTIALLGIGLAGMAAYGVRRRRQRRPQVK